MPARFFRRPRLNRYEPFPEDSSPKSPHIQCQECGRIKNGPGTDEEGAPPRYPYKLHHITEEGEGLTEQEMGERGLKANVSHGVCRDCYPKWRQEYVDRANWGASMREWEEDSEFKETTERVKSEYERTLERVKQNYERTINPPAAEATDETGDFEDDSHEVPAEQ